MNQAEFNWDASPKKDATEVPSSLLEKIKKLLRLAASDNPHEAALAMSRAMAMADRANLDLSSLRDDDEVGQIVERWIPVGSRLSREKALALGVVATYFNVEPVLFKSRGTVVFVGKDSDIAIAEYVFVFLTRVARDCLAAYEDLEKKARRRTGGSKRANFLAGFFYGVIQQLDQGRAEILIEDHKFAVVLADQKQAREDYVASELGPTTAVGHLRKPRRNHTALDAGYRDGRNTSINPGLTAKEPVLSLAGA